MPVFSGGFGPDGTGFGMNFYDMMGIFRAFRPKFVKQYLNLYEPMLGAVNAFYDDVNSGAYPSKEHCYNVHVEGF